MPNNLYRRWRQIALVRLALRSLSRVFSLSRYGCRGSAPPRSLAQRKVGASLSSARRFAGCRRRKWTSEMASFPANSSSLLIFTVKTALTLLRRKGVCADWCSRRVAEMTGSTLVRFMPVVGDDDGLLSESTFAAPQNTTHQKPWRHQQCSVHRCFPAEWSGSPVCRPAQRQLQVRRPSTGKSERHRLAAPHRCCAFAGATISRMLAASFNDAFSAQTAPRARPSAAEMLRRDVQICLRIVSEFEVEALRASSPVSRKCHREKAVGQHRRNLEDEQRQSPFHPDGDRCDEARE